MLIAINHDLFSLGGCFVSEFRYKQWAFAQKVKAEFDQGGRGVLIFFFNAMYGMQVEKAVATHSSVLDWRIPGTGESGGLPSTRSHRVRHD